MSSAENEKPRLKKRFFVPVLVILGLAAFLAIYINDSSKFQETDDAYVETLPVQVSAKVSGPIEKVYVEDNQEIENGALVAEIDPTDYKIKLEEITAKYRAALLKQKNSQATLKAVNSEIDLANRNLTRYKNLYKDGAISKQELDNAQTKFDETEARLIQANEDILSSGKNRVADAELKQLEAAKKQAELNLSYTKIYAPIKGYVTKKAIEKGAYIQVGQPIFVLVPDKVWIVANFKESQLENMRENQDVEIKIDTYPNKIFKGKIDSIQRSSGAKSSLFPPENAVGSFVKIVQRIPVKIIFTESIDPQYIIVPGMSVVPRVRVK